MCGMLRILVTEACKYLRAFNLNDICITLCIDVTSDQITSGKYCYTSAVQNWAGIQ